MALIKFSVLTWLNLVAIFEELVSVKFLPFKVEFSDSFGIARHKEKQLPR